MSRAPMERPLSPPGERSEEPPPADGGLRLVERASFVVLGIDAALAVCSPLWFVFGDSEPATFWWLILLYGLALSACLVQVVRGRGVWWLVPGLAIATAGNWLDSWVFDLDRVAAPSPLPLVLLAALAATALRRRQRQQPPRPTRL